MAAPIVAGALARKAALMAARSAGRLKPSKVKGDIDTLTASLRAAPKDAAAYAAKGRTARAGLGAGAMAAMGAAKKKRPPDPRASASRIHRQRDR